MAVLSADPYGKGHLLIAVWQETIERPSYDSRNILFHDNGNDHRRCLCRSAIMNGRRCRSQQTDPDVTNDVHGPGRAKAQE